MSGTDASFLYFETPSSHMHVLGTIVVDTSAVPGWGYDEVVRLFSERLPLLPQFRRKILSATLRLHHPVWVDVPHVDVAAHISRVHCPAPGGMAELADQAASFASQQLDRSRPLWEALVVEGMADGRVAVVMKMHHCATDGVGAARILGAIFDLTAEGRTPEQLAADVELLASVTKPEPGLADIVKHTAGGMLAWPLNFTKVMPTAVRSVARLISHRVGDDDTSGGAVPFNAPRASFNGRITAGRIVAYSDISVADIKRIKGAVGGTFNDAVIAVCGGALRRYLLDRDELPDASLIAVVPVSVRAGDDDISANAVSAMFTTLGTDLDDPLARLAAVRQSNLVGKGTQAAVGDTLLSQVTQLAPPTVTSVLARFYSGMRLADLHRVVHNVVISNVPGPPIHIYLGGAEVVGLYPLGPVLEGPGLNITLVSYADRVCVGLIACSDRMPDLPDLAAAMRTSVAEMLAALDDTSDTAG
jgi:WS/DGAT/MGAT family acyltransferase